DIAVRNRTKYSLPLGTKKPIIFDCHTFFSSSIEVTLDYSIVRMSLMAVLTTNVLVPVAGKFSALERTDQHMLLSITTEILKKVVALMLEI
ncbi:hypothetical protein J0S82_003515, partial [Galemys pyrenaicus]